MFDDIGPDLDEARAKIKATRAALQAALDGQEAPDERLTALVARLDRMVDDLKDFARLEARRLELSFGRWTRKSRA